MITSQKLQLNLAQFTDTLNWYKNPLLSYRYTDGVKYFAQYAECYWLLQEINALWQRRGNESFFDITVKSKEHTADIVVEDGNGKPLLTRKIPFTDLPEGDWKFYLTGHILMSPSEY